MLQNTSRRLARLSPMLSQLMSTYRRRARSASPARARRASPGRRTRAGSRSRGTSRARARAPPERAPRRRRAARASGGRRAERRPERARKIRFDGFTRAAKPAASPATAAVPGSRLSIARTVKTADASRQTVPCSPPSPSGRAAWGGTGRRSGRGSGGRTAVSRRTARASRARPPCSRPHGRRCARPARRRTRARSARARCLQQQRPGSPPRKPGPPIHANGTSRSGQPCETSGTVMEPWPSSQPVVQNQIWSPPW